MAGPNDLGYKYLFTHPELVRELLVDFTEFHALGALAPSAFERVNPGYVSDRFLERHDDIVWRARVGEQWFYIDILLEFQSGIDRWIALRMQVYIGLLYQDLVKRKELAPRALLPPVLPLVFYSGAAAWTAATDLATMIVDGPDKLAPFQAAQRYVLIDQQRLDPEALAEKPGVLAMRFRLELSEVPDVLKKVLPLLGAWLVQDAQAPLRRSVLAWVEQLMARQFKASDMPAVLAGERESDMGARKCETWADYLEDKGRQQGLQLGIEQGMQQGMQQGRELAAGSVRSALKDVLGRRFGVVPPAALTLLDQASLEELGVLLVRARDTPSIAALLALPADS